ncbi:MAG: pyruvate formate lyase family protein [Bacillota bacterium]|nr:pyruvate formate lyase family protein [Bacillota bacterium]
MITKRVQRLKDRFMLAKPNITPERLLLSTEAFKKYAGEGGPLFRAKVLAYVLDNLSVTIHEDELIVGVPTYTLRGTSVFPEYASTEWLLDEIPGMPTRPMDQIDIKPEDEKVIMDCLRDYWQGKAMEDLFSEVMPPDVMEMYDDEVIYIGLDKTTSGETVPDYKSLLAKGLRGYVNDCKERIEKEPKISAEAYKKIDFWKSCIIACEALIRFANRYADKAEELAAAEKDSKRKEELLKIASNCRRVPENTPTDFYEALQFVWFIHLTFHIEATTTACSFGRFDQTLFPYMKMEMDAGTFDEDKDQEILECFFLKCGELIDVRNKWDSIAYAGFPMWAIVMIGGRDIYGNDATNKLSYMCLTAGADCQTAQPVLAMRVSDDTPEDLFRQAAEMIQAGMANPGFFSEDNNVNAVLHQGGTEEEAKDWVIVGCTQPHCGGGGTEATPDAGYANFAKALELVLHNGVDPRTGKDIGIHTGDPTKFTTKEELIEACKVQIKFMYDKIIEGFNIIQIQHALRMPVVFASLVLDGCIQNGRSTQEGGTRHNSAGLFCTGSANLADSIVAIEQVVFKDKTLTMQELIDILDKNFEGEERIRQLLLKKPPKFGNDNPYVDNINKDILQEIAEYVQSKEDAIGGYFDFTLMTQSQNVSQGAVVGATPDGRMAWEPLSDNASPMMGRDVNGPTATVKSVAHLDPEYFHAGALFNLRFDPRGVQGEKGIETIEGVIRTFFKEGGLHIQINVVDNETLLKAQEKPEDYRGLVVRVAGYMAYFTELDKEVQDAVIGRTAHMADA